MDLIVVIMFCLHFLRKPPERNSASFSIKRMEPVSESCLQAASRVLTTRSSGGKGSIFRQRFSGEVVNFRVDAFEDGKNKSFLESKKQ